MLVISLQEWAKGQQRGFGHDVDNLSGSIVPFAQVRFQSSETQFNEILITFKFKYSTRSLAPDCSGACDTCCTIRGEYVSRQLP